MKAVTWPVGGEIVVASTGHRYRISQHKLTHYTTLNIAVYENVLYLVSTKLHSKVKDAKNY